MTSSTRYHLPHENILLFGVLKALQSAFIACIFAVFLQLSLLAINSAWRDGLPSMTALAVQLVSMLLIGIVLVFCASPLVIFPAFFGGLALAWLIRTQNAQSPYKIKTWQGWVVGGIAGFLVLLIVFLIFAWVNGMGNNVITYEPNAAFLHTFYVIEFISLGGVAGAWTHRQVRRQFLEDSADEAGYR